MTKAFSVRDAADQTGVSVYTLHYYEREGLLRTSRTQSGHRRYAESYLGWIRILTCLRQTGMPIRKMREFAALVQQDQSKISANPQANIEARIRMLEEHRSAVLVNIARGLSQQEAAPAGGLAKRVEQRQSNRDNLRADAFAGEDPDVMDVRRIEGRRRAGEGVAKARQRRFVA